MANEIWKDILGYKGYYQVSNLGRVRSLDREVSHPQSGKNRLPGKILKLGDSGNGYLQVTLSKDSKTKNMRVHQLVAMAFLDHEPCGYKLVVDHIDGDKLNNRMDNLQLITPRENTSKDRVGGTSKYIGVSWFGRDKKWKAQIQINGEIKFIGYFHDEYQAHLAYQKELKQYLNNKK